MSAAQLQDVPPNDEIEAMAWVIEKYIGVCEWESVVTCFSEYAVTIASGDPLTYIACICNALVAIVNCQNSRCAVTALFSPWNNNNIIPSAPNSHPSSASDSLATSLVAICSASVSSGVPREQGGAL